MISTSKKKPSNSGGNTLEFFIPVKPVPASRPRISKYGNYYAKTYTDFRKEAYKFLKDYKVEPKANVGFKVTLEVICYKPKKPSNSYPRGDSDNYAKSYLDSFTYASIAWEDDIQVVELIVTKRYQEEDEPYGCKVRIEEL